MHILLTNDDGPPDPASSPYVSTFISVLCSPPFSHTVSVILPTTQRSWIGKAHLLPQPSGPAGGQSNNDDVPDVIRPVYYDPSNGSTHSSPSALRAARNANETASAAASTAVNFPEYYVLIPGSPSTCSQLGLFHHSLLFPDSPASPPSTPYNPDMLSDPPIDLLISGPNYGRNTTAAFALSSGTIGGALEGAICGVKAIAVSFGFFTRTEPEAVVREASELSVRIVERLMAEWDRDAGREEEGDRAGEKPDLYSVNVPLVEGVAHRGVKWTWMLGNKWSTGSLYKAIGREQASEAREQASGGHAAGLDKVAGERDGEGSGEPPTFKWSPTFGDIWKTVETSPAGNDGHVIRDQRTSVTPLKANFKDLYGVQGYRGEMKL